MRIALFLKLGLLAVFVVLAFDGANLARSAYGADSEAGNVARAATTTYSSTKNVQAAYDAAVAALAHPDDVIDTKDFVFDANGAVTLTLHRKADSVVLGRLREQWTQITVSGHAARPSS